jgi:quercetin dioxygenase-like cupin family protein
MNTMTTVSEVLNKLKKDGYTIDFNLKDNCLECHGNSLQIYPGEFVVDKHYRFEGITDPGDEAVVYAISSAKHSIKGTLINGYGIYSDKIVDDMVKALNINTSLADTKNSVTPEGKFNEATPQRPNGDRPLDAELITMNLYSLKQQLKQEETWKTSDRNSIALFKSDNMRIVLIALHKGAEMKTHVAPGIISVQVLEGQIHFRTEKQNEEMKEGQMLTLHAGIAHSVYAQEESIFLLTLGTANARK